MEEAGELVVPLIDSITQRLAMCSTLMEQVNQQARRRGKMITDDLLCLLKIQQHAIDVLADGCEIQLPYISADAHAYRLSKLPRLHIGHTGRTMMRKPVHSERPRTRHAQTEKVAV